MQGVSQKAYLLVEFVGFMPGIARPDTLAPSSNGYPRGVTMNRFFIEQREVKVLFV
ncbi:MAG: hypothetical protein UW77_C0003G0015 [candidate division WWE3 bacterium GW2011_GWC2_44_85]|nr:MAG: hypothetical protein UW77_C0003G0015 [candidate division WWE3 bacterium GW2011_GWC2_44_85]